MTYAIRKDGQGWRAVNSKDDCSSDEVFSRTQPDPIVINSRIAEIKYRFDEINYASVRPMRAIYAGTDSAEDHTRLAELEAEAASLRLELSEIE